MDIVNRLLAFKNWTNLTSSQFADKARIPRPTLSQFLNGRNKRLSDDLISKLHVAFPELNVLWLLFGSGEMLVNRNIDFSEGKNADFEGGLFSQTTDQQTVTPDNFDQNFVEDFEQSSILTDTADKNAQNRPSGVATTPQAAAQNTRTVTVAQPAAQPAQAPVAANDNTAQALLAEALAQATQAPGIPCKRIKYITVFYDDNSYEVFARPGQAPQ
ncbi:MAG: helix-turn-helix domain-containing protein [Muribaculaceae bacterium]